MGFAAAASGSDEGIVRDHTIPYTPQQNGVAERMNRTIISKARCMLSNDDVTDAVDFSDNSYDEQQRIRVQVEHVEEKENDVAENDNTVVQHSPPVLQQTNSSIAADRPRRNKGPHPRLIEEYNLVHHALSCAEQVEHDTEPATYTEAVASVDRVKWIFAMQEEMQSLDKNGTWDVVPLPKQKKAVRFQLIHLQSTTMLSQYLLSRHTSKRVMAPSHVTFCNVEQLHIYNRSWEATAKLISGRIKNNRGGDLIYHAILADENISVHRLVDCTVGVLVVVPSRRRRCWPSGPGFSADNGSALATDKTSEELGGGNSLRGEEFWMSSTAGDVGEVKENDDKHSHMVGCAKMISTVEEVREIKEDDNNQSDMVGCDQMSSTDGDMGEITENDIDDTKKYIMSFPPKTKLVRIDDACLKPTDFEECLFPDDGWLDGDLIMWFVSAKIHGRMDRPGTSSSCNAGRPELPQPDQKGEAGDVLMWEGNGPPPTELSQGYQVANATSPPFKIIKKSIKKVEAVAKLRKYILSVNDDEAKTKNEVPSANKENEVPYKDDEWLRRNDNYQRQSIPMPFQVPMPFQGPEIIPTDVIATYCTQESHGGPSTVCQLESTPAVKGDTARDKENLVPDDNDALHMQLSHMSSQGQGSLVTVNKETEVPLAHKENEVHSQDDEWLRRNDNYQMQSIPMLLQGQEIIPTGEDEGVILEEDSEDEEGYMFAGQEDDADEDVEIDEVNDGSTSVPNIPDPYDMVYNKIPTETHMLKPVDNCKHTHCGAKKFEHEPPGFCCRNGQIKLANTDTPPELMRLWTSEDPDARHFRDNIRFFNGHFSFTSLYCNLDGDTTNTSKHPIYTFRAHGKMYHNIRSFGRIDGLQGSHLELYFFDDDPNLEHRYRSCRKEQCAKDKEVITQIVNILKGNPYSEHLRSMGEVEDIDDYRITLNLDQRMDQRTYNAPTTSEVAAVWVEGSERRRQFDHSVILQGKNRDIYGIKSYHGCYDALSYPLFFPRGELGWHTDIPKRTVSYDTVMAARAARLARRNNDESSQSPDNNNDDGDEDNDPASGGNKCVSVRDYYCYKFQMRPGIFNPILHGKRLFQQFAVDTYIKIENSRLDYMWNHQDKIRADLYQGLMDSLHAGEGSADAIGKRTVLSGTFIGGPRDKRRRYMDAMALVRKYGKPDIFLTMTCNPNWDEIKRELYPGQTPQDRPDLVVRVFRAKLEELKNKLFQKDILGKIKAYVYVVEFQKRGLPHAHFLLIMEGRLQAHMS
ncbi:hypothetical protein QYE76_062511 [Lolium multiflorum]|uniref:Helitron helicase-like domain-containing protein n=1 Tax=Lolium multiflorum TaxID=4521 RepID=A0AAD8S2T7_LOLMU|nr:hypothetical protein QYE76_062511 [Lolium multiflorum]